MERRRGGTHFKNFTIDELNPICKMPGQIIRIGVEFIQIQIFKSGHRLHNFHLIKLSFFVFKYKTPKKSGVVDFPFCWLETTNQNRKVWKSTKEPIRQPNPTLLLGLSKYFVDKPLALNQILRPWKNIDRHHG